MENKIFPKITHRRRFLKIMGGVSTCIGMPSSQAATIAPFPVRPKIQRKTDTLILGYFGDSTTRGAWAANNPLPYPNNYSYINLAEIVQAELSDFAPIKVYQKGENAQSGAVLLNGGYIPTSEAIRISPFATRLTEEAYDAAIVGVGICDALAGQTPLQFQNTLAGIFSTAQRAGIPLIFETPNPIPLSVAYAEVESYRPFFRAYDLVVDQNYHMDMSDEFHPTPDEYLVKASRLAQYLKSCIIRKFTFIGG